MKKKNNSKPKDIVNIENSKKDDDFEDDVKIKAENNSEEIKKDTFNVSKMNIDEEIKAIKDMKKGKAVENKDSLSKEKIDKKENNEEIDLFKMIEDENTTEIEIKEEFDDGIKKDNLKKDNSKSQKKEKETESLKKSKLTICLLLLALITIIYSGVNFYLKLDLNNLVLSDLIKFGSFLFISLLIIIILFKINNKKTTPYALLVTVILILFAIFSSEPTYALPTSNYVLDFINEDVSKVMDWAEKNNLELEILHEYSDTVLKNHVIMQEYGITTLVSEIKDTFKITVSDGPNYDKTLVVPNLTGFTFDDVMAYIKENNLNNVEIEFVVSDVKRDTVIEQIGSGTLKRNDKIIFKFSYGPDELEKIPVKDLKNLSEFEATAYLKRYNIFYEITYSYDQKIEKGYVIKQSVVNQVVDDKLVLTVSLGKEIVVPDFLKMSTNEITKWAMANNINIVFNEEYNKEYASGKVIKASHQEKEKVKEGETITITISKGSMTMPKITNLAEFKLWANENKVNFEEVYEFSNDIAGGEIIKTEPAEGTKLSENDTIILTISRGKQITIPNFVGMSKSNIQARCNTLKLSCSFTYGDYSDTIARDVATYQSKNKGTVVAEGTNLTITLSSGIHEKVTIPNFTGKTRNQIQASCDSLGIVCKFVNNSTYSKETINTAISQDKTGTVYKGEVVTITLSLGLAKSYNIVIDASLFTQGNAEQTKNTLKNLLESKCQGVNFIFSFQPANYGIGYLSENSEVKVGQNTFVQGKTYKVIINANA